MKFQELLGFFRSARAVSRSEPASVVNKKSQWAANAAAVKDKASAGGSEIPTPDSVLARLAALERKIDRLEMFSHGSRATYVGNNRVLTKTIVADQQIAFYVEANDRLLSPWFIVAGGYETQLTDFFVRSLRPDSHSIDVGANFGYFTCLMARFCPSGRVIGIEADEHMFEIVRDNIFINGFQSFATAVHAAAGSSDDEMTLHRRGTRSGNTSIARMPDHFISQMGEPDSTAFTVRGLRIDSLLDQMNGRIDFIKIDVEGAEPLVIRGARKIFEASPKVTIVMEWSPGQIQSVGIDVQEFLRELDEIGLTAFDIEAADLVAITFADLLNVPYRTGIVLKLRG